MSIESVMPCNHLILCRPLQQYTVLICSFPDLEPEPDEEEEDIEETEPGNKLTLDQLAML